MFFLLRMLAEYPEPGIIVSPVLQQTSSPPTGRRLPVRPSGDRIINVTLFPHNYKEELNQSLGFAVISLKYSQMNTIDMVSNSQ